MSFPSPSLRPRPRPVLDSQIPDISRIGLPCGRCRSGLYNPPVSIVGIDYGGRRIGIAVSESGFLATPHSVIANDGDLDTVVERLIALASAVDAELLVLGVPRRAVSRSGEEKFEHLATALRQRTCKEVILWDETLSTVEAAAQRRASGKRGREIRADIDMHAAAVILQSYLDHRSGRTS